MSNITENATSYEYISRYYSSYTNETTDPKNQLSHINLPNGVTNVYMRNDGIDNIIAIFKFNPTSFTIFKNCKYDYEIIFIGDPLDQDLPLSFKCNDIKIRQNIKMDQTYKIYSNSDSDVSKDMTTSTWNIHYTYQQNNTDWLYIYTIIIDKINELRQTQFDAMLK